MAHLEELGEGDLAALAPRLVHILSEQLLQLHLHLRPAVPADDPSGKVTNYHFLLG